MLHGFPVSNVRVVVSARHASGRVRAHRGGWGAEEKTRLSEGIEETEREAERGDPGGGSPDR